MKSVSLIDATLEACSGADSWTSEQWETVLSAAVRRIKPFLRSCRSLSSIACQITEFGINDEAEPHLDPRGMDVDIEGVWMRYPLQDSGILVAGVSRQGDWVMCRFALGAVSPIRQYFAASLSQEAVPREIVETGAFRYVDLWKLLSTVLREWTEDAQRSLEHLEAIEEEFRFVDRHKLS